MILGIRVRGYHGASVVQGAEMGGLRVIHAYEEVVKDHCLRTTRGQCMSSRFIAEVIDDNQVFRVAEGETMYEKRERVAT